MKAARKAEGLTRRDLALYMHKSESTIKAWETPMPAGSEPSNLREVSRLLKRLKIPAELYIHCEQVSEALSPEHILALKLFDRLTKKQRRVLLQLMQMLAAQNTG